MKHYEALIILNPDLEGDALQISIKETIDLLKKHQCEIENVDEWGKRPLSYDISKKQQGTFYLVRFTADPKNIKAVKRGFSLYENILRALVTVCEKTKSLSEETKTSS